RMRETDVASYFSAPYRAPHNIVLGTLIELGPVGLFLLAMFIGPLILRAGWGPEGTIVQAAVASLAVNALFLDVLERKELWLFLGIACGLAYLARHAPS